jgi:hypothetical protein
VALCIYEGSHEGQFIKRRSWGHPVCSVSSLIRLVAGAFELEPENDGGEYSLVGPMTPRSLR